MPAYLVVGVVYKNQHWTETYRRDVPALVTAHGGRYLAKAFRPERLEGRGQTPDTLAILEFPTEAAARAMLSAPEYQPYAEARRLGAETSMFIL